MRRAAAAMLALALAGCGTTVDLGARGADSGLGGDVAQPGATAPQVPGGSVTSPVEGPGAGPGPALGNAPVGVSPEAGTGSVPVGKADAGLRGRIDAGTGHDDEAGSPAAPQ